MKLGRFRPVGLLGELGLSSFSEVPHLAFNFMLYFNFISVTFDEKLEVTEGTRQFTKRLLYCPLSAQPWFLYCIFWRANPGSPNVVGYSLKGLPISDLLLI